MLILAIALYFVIACLISWMVLFPAGREFVLNALAGAGQRLQQRVGRLAARGQQDAGALGRTGRASAGEIGAFLRQHYVLCLGGAALICIPPLLALMMSTRSTLSGFETSTREVNTQVADLLQGEQLVPPPTLPPLVFASAEVALERPMLVSASRDWALMDAAYAQRLLMAFKIMKEKHGYDMAILEGYRSPERQNALAAMGPNVTNAAAFQSWHQYGLAADCAFLRDGKLVISEKDPWAMRGYQLYGEVAESLGLTWGGRWKMMDFGHTELRVAGVMKR
ncbi:MULTISPECIES: M15 family metallopeptidase [Oxalobacteraceae]|uniref:M15 family metallopeptidase n=1 Tax=Oxalobacteraceae TaxID=75682 RepID=UPI0002AEB78F|nr:MULTISPECIES: M15 family metallopeptidase [Oxalobacteraceae]ELX08959.1 serine-type D-ala-D-ala carboxypeptidase [Janthinobacterium sp. HH01]OEZ63603.1 peptidoglycan L-alanyl-D-glutamate endopeptidase CwlK precursor [Duganella sp. HH105]OFA03681.1 peptidoglycan L-alanyl-D-glutamate endopeptidase CwlK precursor [Duganella sp. HH101]